MMKSRPQIAPKAVTGRKLLRMKAIRCAVDHCRLEKGMSSRVMAVGKPARKPKRKLPMIGMKWSGAVNYE